MKKVRIPGKVMLSGEYAVLYGGTAVLVPVPRFLEITEISNAPEKPYPRVVNVGLEYKITETIDYESKHGLPNLKIDNREFYSEDTDGKLTKLGLGLSAAEAVGVVVIRYKRAGITVTEHKTDITRYGMDIHRKAQSGFGSGADVALCVYGEPIRFCNIDNDFHIELISDDNRINIMPITLAWTGQPADTRGFVQRFQIWVKKGGNKTKKIVSHLVEISNQLGKAWFFASIQDLFILLDEFNSIMEHIANKAQIPYKLPIHGKIENWARKHGGYAKPTGAGGGDMILIIGDLPFHELKQVLIPLKLGGSFSEV